MHREKSLKKSHLTWYFCCRIEECTTLLLHCTLPLTLSIMSSNRCLNGMQPVFKRHYFFPLSLSFFLVSFFFVAKKILYFWVLLSCKLIFQMIARLNLGGNSNDDDDVVAPSIELKYLNKDGGEMEISDDPTPREAILAAVQLVFWKNLIK